MILDCENIDTCIESLASILIMPSILIMRTLAEMDLEAIYRRNRILVSPDTFLLNYFKKHFNVGTEFNSSYWFHNSRVKKGGDFNAGILPLNLIHKEITTFVDSLAQSIERKPDNKSFSNNSNGGYHFLTKTNEKSHWVPYGYLVRQTAIKCPAMSHDYLKIPEIVEDYIGCKYNNIFEELQNKYFENTISCVVKFIAFRNEENLIGNALYYLYLSIRGEELNMNSNTGFDNNAQIINADRIVKIEYLLK